MAIPNLTIVATHKTCSLTSCKQVNPQPIENFGKNKSTITGLQYDCKACRNASYAAWSTANPDTAKLNNKVYYATKGRDLRYKKIYGISLIEYNDLFSQQSGSCKICKTHQSELSKSLAVDHIHGTEVIRGLLCHACNAAVGLLKENPDLIRLAAQYVEDGYGDTD